MAAARGRDFVGGEGLHLGAQHVGGLTKVEVQADIRIGPDCHVRASSLRGAPVASSGGSGTSQGVANRVGGGNGGAGAIG